jgi:26S proteasome regulatory subunit N8
MVFHHIASEIGAFEAEEVGIEHLLRDVKDTTISTLATQVNKKINSLKSLVLNIDEIQTYLSNVASGKLPINQQILGHLQDLFNLSPNMNVDSLTKPFTLKTNDFMLSIYVASMIRSILALHSLLKNKKDLIEHEKTASGELPAKDSKDTKDAKDSKDEKKEAATDSKDANKKK